MTIQLEDTAQFRWQTDFERLLAPLRQQIEPLNWLITDLRYHFIDDQQPQEIPDWDIEWGTEKQFAVVSGETLWKSVANRDIQVVWGVFCGVSGKMPDVPDDELPYADGNRQMWAEPEAFYLAASKIEIICWDSSLTWIRFRDESVGRQFLLLFPEGQIVRNPTNN
ncbi:MAG: hypothetical protein EOO63_07495 [Hymenobacter sp.]|nr:MAG: hypothetical protein EOO63_07495 [Hymenobacter sp.]